MRQYNFTAILVARQWHLPLHEGRFSIARRSPDDWARVADEWRRLGATHLHVVTMDAGLQSPAEHIAVPRQIKQALGT